MTFVDNDLEKLTERRIRLVDGILLRCEICGFTWGVKIVPVAEKRKMKPYKVNVLTLPGNSTVWSRCPRCSLKDDLFLQEASRRDVANPLRISDTPMRTDIAITGYKKK